MRKVFFMFLTVFLSVVVCAQNYSGVVNDESGDPVSGVKVEFVNSDSETTTNASGEWSATLGVGSEIIVFGKDGYTYEQVINQVPSTSIEVTLRDAVDSYATNREAIYKTNGCTSVSIPNNATWNASFEHSELKGDLAPDQNYTRRDPSAVIKVADKYYVWYSYSPTVMTGKQAPWDMNDLYYATSTDGETWTEQGAAIERGVGSTYDTRSAFTTEIFVHNNTYYLVYQAAADVDGIYNRNTVCMASASSPDGPWTKVSEPVLRPTYTNDLYFDNNAVHDPCIVHYNSKFYLYYKGECNCMDNAGCSNWCNPVCGLGKQVKWGVAVADSPTGPYVKSKYNPITNTGHEIMVWPYKTGMAILQHQDGPEALSIQYSEDGMNFDIKGSVIGFPEAAGLFRNEKSDTDPHSGISWGMGHVLKWDYGPKGWMYIYRYDLVKGNDFEISADNFIETDGTYDDDSDPIDEHYGFGKNSNGGVNSVNSGDWATYNITIDSAGIYEVKFYTSTPSNNAELKLYVDDALVITDNVPYTGEWDDYSSPFTSSSTFTLSQGSHVLKLEASGSNNWEWNMKKFVLVKVADINVGACNEISGDNITLHPNPANDIVNVSGIEGEFGMKLFSADGKLLRDSDLKNNAEIDIRNLDNGVYYILLDVDTKIVTKRLLINR